MPSPSSYADVIRDWEGLLVAVKNNLERLPYIENYASILQEYLDVTKELKSRQDSASALRQRTTQELEEQLLEGRAQAIRLRGAVKAALGHTNERLVQFGIAPTRRRVRRPKVVEVSTIEDVTPAVPPSTDSGSTE